MERLTDLDKSGLIFHVRDISLSLEPNPPGMDSFTFPSEAEASGYYVGIPGKPRLVARSPGSAWAPSYIDNYLRLKGIFTIGVHKLRAEFDGANDIRPDLHQALQGIVWKSMDFVRIGYEESPAYPTILVTVPAGIATPQQTKDAVMKIWRICQERDLTDISVELIEGTLEKSTTTIPTLPNVPYPDVPLCGTSIGPVVPLPDDSSSGTLGCFVTIDGPQKGRYALTNDHVCFTQFRPRPYDKQTKTDTESQRAELLSKFARFSISATNSVASFAMEAPSTSDHLRCQEDIQDELENNKRKYEDLEKKFDAAKSFTGPPLSKGQLANMNQIQTWVAEGEAQLNQISHFNKLVGTVMVASGHQRNRQNHRLDWALIDLSKKRFKSSQDTENKFPPYDFRRSEISALNKGDSDYPYRFSPRTAYANPPVLDKIRTIQEIETAIKNDDTKTLKVLKHGRTTGWTGGAVNEIKSSCVYTGDLDQTPSTEIMVVGLTERDFCMRGDSGAIVFDLKGEVVGLMHGFKQEGGLGYVTPIESIFADIKEQTGATRVEFEHFEI